MLPCPTIVIPGITATTLRDTYPVDPERVWSLPDAASGTLATLNRHFERVALHPDDLRYELQQPARVVPDALFGLPYTELVAELRHNLSAHADEPVPVYPFAYDWRQPLEVSEDQLAAFIEEVIGRTALLRHYHNAGYGSDRFPAQVHLVAHSMGGLVAAGYLARHGFHRVDRVVSLGSPFRGSHEAVLKVATGLATLGTASSSSREREVARLTPALYYLLPEYPGAVEAARGCATSLFSPETWQPAILATLAEHIRLHGLAQDNLAERARTLFASLLSQAHQHRRRLESLSLPDPSRWLCIVGIGNRTRIRLRIENRDGTPWFNLTGEDRLDNWKPAGPPCTETGDGTVPYPGARAAFIPAEQIVCLAPKDLGYWEIEDRVLQAASGLHPVLPKVNLIHRLATSHLLQRRVGDLWGRRAPDLPASKSWQPPLPGLVEKDPPRRPRRPRN